MALKQKKLSTWPKKRELRIDVLDALAKPLLGAGLDVLINGHRVGVARDIPGVAHVCLREGDERAVEVRLILPNGTPHSSAVLWGSKTMHVFNVGMRFSPRHGVAEAHCAEGGRVGQPCVECDLDDGETIEICAH